MENAILLILREDPSANQSDIAAKTGKSIATVKRAMKGLADTGMIRRVGGKRYGHWEFGE